MGSLETFVTSFENKAKEYFAHRKAEASDVVPLIEAMEYSFFNGGKRFRPQLCFAVGQAVGLQEKDILPFAMAVEAIHTYSLIHDDLPCMDDDDQRRGQPTNHKKFGEAMALLAGDALLTEAFLMLHWGYTEKASKLVEVLSKGSGLLGMIRGQVLDLGLGQPINELGDLTHLHQMKTGQLMAISCEAPAIIKGLPSQAFFDLGLMIGLAFQVKDDLLDVDDNDQASFIHFLGIDGTQNYLNSLSEKIEQQIKNLELDSPFLLDLIAFNQSRMK